METAKILKIFDLKIADSFLIKGVKVRENWKDRKRTHHRSI